MKDFFISYTALDVQWAEWIAWQLETSGYSVIIQQWDFLPGSNFVISMQEACLGSETTIAVLSNEYLAKAFPASEWAAAFARDPMGNFKTFIPVRISPVNAEGLLASIVYIDLLKADDEKQAIKVLLDGVNKTRKKPQVAPSFPLNTQLTNKTEPEFPLMDSGLIKQQNSRIVCQKILGSQLLDLNSIDHPFGVLNDPTDFVEAGNTSIIQCVIWVPHPQYLKEGRLQNHTAAVAICFDGQSNAAKGKWEDLDVDVIKLLSLRPAKLRNDEKEKIFTALGSFLSQSFIAAITLPSIMLEAGRKNPMVVYSSFFDMLLLPLVQMNKQHSIKFFHLILPKLEGQASGMVSATKKIIKAIYHEKGSYQVSVDDLCNVENNMGNVVRFVAWAVGASHNSENDNWLQCLERGIENSAFSHMEETELG